jgi:hypothetical protein
MPKGPEVPSDAIGRRTSGSAEEWCADRFADVVAAADEIIVQSYIPH